MVFPIFFLLCSAIERKKNPLQNNIGQTSCTYYDIGMDKKGEGFIEFYISEMLYTVYKPIRSLQTYLKKNVIQLHLIFI